MGTPILSVVIPTYRRPQYLSRAIDSALFSAPDGDVEVIIVPNGSDESWKGIARSYAAERRVNWQPISARHANIARNYGKQIASGKYIRFLDDDDYLLPPYAKNQLLTLEVQNAEVCTGSIDAMTESGKFIKHMPIPDTSGDLFSMVAHHARLCLPTAHVFLRSQITEFFWNESSMAEQDTDWMLRLSSQREWNWITVSDVVGTWIQHNNHRISSTIGDHARSELVCNYLISSLQNLQNRSALTDARKKAIADGLWGCVHLGFYFSPMRWSLIGREAQRLSPASKPPDTFFYLPWIRNIDPLLIEWLMSPKRWANLILRRGMKRIAGLIKHAFARI